MKKLIALMVVLGMLVVTASFTPDEIETVSATPPDAGQTNQNNDDSGGHDDVLSHTFHWYAGWNMFSVPLNNSDMIDVEDFVLSNPNVTTVSHWVGPSDGYVEYNQTTGGWNGTPTYNFNQKSGYWVFCLNETNITITGERVWGCKYDLVDDWNQLGWNIQRTGYADSDFRPYVTNGSFSAIAKWDAINQQFEYYVFTLDNMTFTPGEGMFVFSDYDAISVNVTDANQSADIEEWFNPNIQNAINNTDENNTILIWEGNYTETTIQTNKTNLTIAGWKNQVNVTSNITVENETAIKKLQLLESNVSVESNITTVGVIFENTTLAINESMGTYVGNATILESTFQGNQSNYKLAFYNTEVENSTFETEFYDDSENSEYRNTTFTNLNISNPIQNYINSTAVISGCDIDQTFFEITGNVSIDNSTASDQIQSRSAYTTINISDSTVRIDDSTFRGGTNVIRLNNCVAYIDNSTFRDSIQACLMLVDSTVYINRSTFATNDIAILLHATGSTVRLSDCDMGNGRLSFTDSNVWINDTAVDTVDVYLSSANTRFFNSTLEGMDYHMEGSNLDCYNSRVSLDDLFFYYDSQCVQYWELNINTTPNTEVWVRDTQYTSDANGHVRTWGTQWTWNTSLYHDMTANNITVKGVDEIIYYLDNITWAEILETTETVSYQLNRGWNIVGIPYNYNTTARDILSDIGNGAKVYRRHANGTYQYTTWRVGKLVGEDFALESRNAYYIYSPHSQPLHFDVANTTEPEVVKYSRGWNLVSIPGDARITFTEFYQQNPGVSKIYGRFNGEYFYYTQLTATDEYMTNTNGYYVFVNNPDGTEWHYRGQ